jgi:hypothetical protein
MVAWRIVVRLADGELDGGFARQFSHERNLNDCVRDVTGALVEPLIEYVQRLLARQSDVLYLLERYARRVAWFEQKRLYDAYQADTQRGESIYDADLRGFLFAQGVDYPYSQPAGPSGKADIVAGLEGDDPLACELKLFDGGSYGASYLAKGLGQAIRYAQDYGKTEAQLVIVNLTDQSIELPNDGAVTDWPPRLQLANVTVFLIVVQGKPRPAASAGGRPKPVRLTRDQLIAEEG